MLPFLLGFLWTDGQPTSSDGTLKKKASLQQGQAR
jgi:hypothetical protein